MGITGGSAEPVRVLSDLSKLLAYAGSYERTAELCARHLARTIGDGCLVELGRTIAVDHRRAEIATSLRGLGVVYLHAHASAQAAYAPIVLDATRGRLTLWRDDGPPFSDDEIALARACGVQVELAFGRVAHREREVAEATRADERAAQLQQLVAMRDEFLSIAAHELRTPMTALGLQLQMLDRLVERHAAEADLRTRAAGAQAALAELTELLDRLLDVTRLSAGRLVLERAELDLRDLIADVCARFQPQAQKAGCALVAELMSVTGRWDRLRVDQIASNLIANAIEYAPGAPVEVRLAGDGDAAYLEVADGGAGLPDEHAARVFDRFVRLSPGRTGLGLGLYISRQLARAHGGELEVDRAPGRGARFRVRLPRA